MSYSDIAIGYFHKGDLVMLDTLGLKVLLTLRALWRLDFRFIHTNFQMFFSTALLSHLFTEWQLIAAHKKSTASEHILVSKGSHFGQKAVNVYQITSSQKRLFPCQLRAKFSIWKSDYKSIFSIDILCLAPHPLPEAILMEAMHTRQSLSVIFMGKIMVL